ncbi:hypothetical protein [uncultured Algibacter sp.]|uniref:hypothetical protein n=1 Tax=uncultured Algibacter sp. TaxID=298659 RepID=UPI003216880A
MKINYNNPLTNQQQKELELNVSETIQLFNDLPFQEDSFLKLNDTNQEWIYRFIYTNNKWMVDHPVVQGVVHKQRYATKNECVQLINGIYNQVHPDNLKDFIDVPKEFTLDEMLEFKHEDDMMLKGQDPYAKTKKTSPTVSKEKAIETKKQTTKKVKPKSLETLGNHIKPKLETPKPNLNKIAEKLIKNKPTDDNSFFQI